MKQAAPWDWLSSEGLLVPNADPALRAAGLLELCDRGLLEGGFAVALDVRPDELVGALCARIGGGAGALRVIDVRVEPRPEMVVRLGAREVRWGVPNNAALVDHFNDAFRMDPAARAVATLGEWKESLQLWCIPKAKVPALLRQAFFRPNNRRGLARATCP